jgi:hypothetical protein
LSLNLERMRCRFILKLIHLGTSSCILLGRASPSILRQHSSTVACLGWKLRNFSFMEINSYTDNDYIHYFAPLKLFATNFPYNLQRRRERIVIHFLSLPPFSSLLFLSIQFCRMYFLRNTSLSCICHLITLTQIHRIQRHMDTRGIQG